MRWTSRSWFPKSVKTKEPPMDIIGLLPGWVSVKFIEQPVFQIPDWSEQFAEATTPLRCVFNLALQAPSPKKNHSSKTWSLITLCPIGHCGWFLGSSKVKCEEAPAHAPLVYSLLKLSFEMEKIGNSHQVFGWCLQYLRFSKEFN